jgi:hypothetical protein
MFVLPIIPLLDGMIRVRYPIIMATAHKFIALEQSIRSSFMQRRRGRETECASQPTFPVHGDALPAQSSHTCNAGKEHSQLCVRQRSSNQSTPTFRRQHVGLRPPQHRGDIGNCEVTCHRWLPLPWNHGDAACGKAAV